MAEMPHADGGGVMYTETGIPYYHSEAGTVYVMDSGPIVYHEAGPVPLPDRGAPASDDSRTRPSVCRVATCLGRTLQCGDCKDNDGDRKIDALDPECLGPCDNTEGPALISGVGGVTGSTCHVDCYFDYGNGMGNDSCWWDHRCDPLEPEAPECSYRRSLVGGKFCPVPQDPACARYCMPLTPNGCDCFGCCTFPQLAGKGAGGTDAFVWIGAKDASNAGTCTLAALLNQTRCPRCTPVGNCYNPCGKCELCVGKTTLPPECYKKPAPRTDGGTTTVDAGVPPTQQCPGGEQPCGLPGQAPCPRDYYCISGCCIRNVVK
jgi:hypothetical protein